MTYAEFDALCAGLPATTHVVQWGGASVWKVAGKVFAIGGWGEGAPAFVFKVSPLSFEILTQLPRRPARAVLRLTWHELGAALRRARVIRHRLGGLPG